MKLKTAVSIVATLMVALFGALSVALTITTDLLDSQARQLARSGESIRVAQSIKNRLLAHNRNVFLYRVTLDPSRFESLHALTTEIDDLLLEGGLLINNAQEQRVLDDIVREWRHYLATLQELESANVASAETYALVSGEADKLIAVVDELTAQNRSQMDELSAAMGRRNRGANLIAVALFVSGTAILSGIAFAVFRYIARPLVELSDVMTRYARTGIVPRADTDGIAEIGNLGANFNALTQRLEQKREEQLRFISAIAHDLRNPLSSMSIATDLLLRQQPTEGQRMLEVIFRQVRFLERLVNDLLDTAHIESGHLELRPAEHDVGTLVVDAVDLHRSTSNLHTFKLDIGDELRCVCDGARVSQVLNNLLGNAIKYSPNGSLVSVRARREDGYVEVAVSDQGIGIAPDEIDKIFKPFNRSTATRSTIPGIGLGLATSRRIAETHGGTLEAVSEPGKGTTFRLRLPCGAADAGGPAQRNRDRTSTSS